MRMAIVKWDFSAVVFEMVFADRESKRVRQPCQRKMRSASPKVKVTSLFVAPLKSGSESV
jgi:hypothetical protein